MQQLKVKLLKKQEVISGGFLFTLESAGLTFLPGQFVNVLCLENSDSILRRPLSVFSADEKTFQLLFEAKGKGTKALSAMEPQDEIDIIAPLGKGFSHNENAVLLAGGIGVAPLNFLANKLKKASVIIGCQTEGKLSTFGLPKRHKTYIATDDGSCGYKGTAPQLLEDKLDEINPDFIYACGPQGMLERVIEIAKKANIKAEVSLERFMACGTGVCLSCVCETKKGYQRVCTEGPIFSSDEF